MSHSVSYDHGRRCECGRQFPNRAARALHNLTEWAAVWKAAIGLIREGARISRERRRA